MSQKHLKSPCCQGKIYKHGQRRRQCSICQKTWRIRQKKKGRKSKRTNTALVKRYLSNGSFNLHEHAKRLKITAPALRKRIRKSLDLFLETEQWLEPPADKDLIAVVDALMEKILTGKQYKNYTIYFVVLRTIDSDEAFILKPVIYPRYENKADWQRAINKIPKQLKDRILALIGDGEPSYITITRDNDWLLQRCHFHLLAELQRFASKKRRSRNKKLVIKIEELVRTIITTSDKHKLRKSLTQILKMINDPQVPTRLKKRFLKGFYRNYELYRTYLFYPELNLPNTSNSCETLCGITRKFLSKTNGINSVKTFYKWIIAIMLNRKKVCCKGAIFPPN